METREYNLTFFENLLGGVPLRKELYKNHVATTEMANDIHDEEFADELSMVREADEIMTGFYSDSEGVYLMDYQIKGFMKEAGNILKDIVKIKALKSKLDNFLFITPRHIWLAEKPSGLLERPLRGMTARGPRIALAKSEYVKAPLTIKIGIQMIPHKELNFEVIETLLGYGELKGIGQWRNGSYGRFKFERI